MRATDLSGAQITGARATIAQWRPLRSRNTTRRVALVCPPIFIYFIATVRRFHVSSAKSIFFSITIFFSNKHHCLFFANSVQQSKVCLFSFFNIVFVYVFNTVSHYLFLNKKTRTSVLFTSKQTLFWFEISRNLNPTVTFCLHVFFVFVMISQSRLFLLESLISMTNRESLWKTLIAVVLFCQMF